MNLRLLRIFKIVYEKQSITEAAKALFISQPAVSQAILELESYLEINLFIRDSGVLRRSDYSHLFYEKSVEVLNLFDELDKFTKRPVRVNMSSSMTMVKTILPKIIKEYEHITNRSLNVNVVNAKEVVRRVLDQMDDLGIVEGLVVNDLLEIIVIDQLQLSFFVAKDSDLAPSTLDELLKEKILLRDKGSSIRDIFEVTLLNLGKKYKPAWESVNSEAIAVAVDNHLGIGLLPDILIDLDRFKIIKVNDIDLVTPVSIIYRKSKQNAVAVQELVETIKNIYQ